MRVPDACLAPVGRRDGAWPRHLSGGAWPRHLSECELALRELHEDIGQSMLYLDGVLLCDRVTPHFEWRLLVRARTYTDHVMWVQTREVPQGEIVHIVCVLSGL